MRFLSMRCSTTFITYLILIQLSTGWAVPVRSSRRSEVRSPFAPRKYANIQARSDVQDNQQLTDENNHETEIVEVTNISEDLIATTEDSSLLEDPAINVTSPVGPTELLLADISGSTVVPSEYVTESVAVHSSQDLADPSIDPGTTPEVVAIVQVSSEASTTPMDLPLYPAVRVPTAPESALITVAPLLETLPLDHVAPAIAGTSNPPSTELPVLPPVTLSELISNNTVSGVKTKTPALSLKYGVPKGKPSLPKHRPIMTSYNPPDTINPYLGEELDKPIYLPPTFPGPADALPSAINLYASEEDNFPRLPFGNSKPKKLEFPPVSNTDENFGYQIDWW